MSHAVTRRGLVLGAYGGASADVHDLVSLAASRVHARTEAPASDRRRGLGRLLGDGDLQLPERALGGPRPWQPGRKLHIMDHNPAFYKGDLEWESTWTMVDSLNSTLFCMKTNWTLHP